eukprot:NODE_3079_length_820_cov_100.101167_g2561_i0.p2 GENE.NODE_3079_length_820_cov_100.101167_g2561_i0~~NODE_3079_length_820_cov_100.101167_g2561_i0.p2  ORF type:complete len:197 (-),score=56.80 NODE_3079_length_820_cov_100.101167_g2561_i0:229-795(-)
MGDFGLSVKVPDSGVLSGVCGTVPYTAPELCSGLKYSFPVDIWAAGTVGYSMYFCQFPYASETCEAMVAELSRSMGGQSLIPQSCALSFAGKQLLGFMLDMNPKNRIKGEEIPQHNFFEDMDWSALQSKQMYMPFNLHHVHTQYQQPKNLRQATFMSPAVSSTKWTFEGFIDGEPNKVQSQDDGWQVL